MRAPRGCCRCRCRCHHRPGAGDMRNDLDKRAISMDLWRAPFSSADSITSLQKRLVRSLFCPAHLWDFFSLTILHLWSHASTTSRTCEVGKPSSIVTVVLCLGKFFFRYCCTVLLLYELRDPETEAQRVRIILRSVYIALPPCCRRCHSGYLGHYFL